MCYDNIFSLAKRPVTVSLYPLYLRRRSPKEESWFWLKGPPNKDWSLSNGERKGSSELSRSLWRGYVGPGCFIWPWRNDGLAGLSVGDVMCDCWKCEVLSNVNTLPRVVWGEIWGDIEVGEKGGDANLDNPVCVEFRGDENEDAAGEVFVTIADQVLGVGDNMASIVIGGEWRWPELTPLLCFFSSLLPRSPCGGENMGSLLRASCLIFLFSSLILLWWIWGDRTPVTECNDVPPMFCSFLVSLGLGFLLLLLSGEDFVLVSFWSPSIKLLFTRPGVWVITEAGIECPMLPLLFGEYSPFKELPLETTGKSLSRLSTLSRSPSSILSLCCVPNTEEPYCW